MRMCVWNSVISVIVSFKETKKECVCKSLKFVVCCVVLYFNSIAFVACVRKMAISVRAVKKIDCSGDVANEFIESCKSLMVKDLKNPEKIVGPYTGGGLFSKARIFDCARLETSRAKSVHRIPELKRFRVWLSE